MKKDLLNAFTTLLAHHGSHCAVARSIGLTQDHYRAMRNGRVNIPQRTADYIILKASEVDSSCQASVSPIEQPAEARP